MVLPGDRPLPATVLSAAAVIRFSRFLNNPVTPAMETVRV